MAGTGLTTDSGHQEDDSTPGARAFRRPVAWILVSLVVIGLALWLDDWVAKVLVLPSPSVSRDLAGWVSRLGEGWVVALAGGAGAVALFFLGRLTPARLVFLAASTGLLTGLAATLLRVLVGRTRPHAHVAQGFYGLWHDGQWLVGQYDFSSFPSGHAATVIGLATAAWMVNRRWGVLAGIYALLVSWSRIAAGSHHFSDVVAAAILGVLGAYWIVRWCRPLVEAVSQRLHAAWTRSRNRAQAPPSSHV